jgi:hypothetical protein
VPVISVGIVPAISVGISVIIVGISLFKTRLAITRGVNVNPRYGAYEKLSLSISQVFVNHFCDSLLVFSDPTG